MSRPPTEPVPAAVPAGGDSTIVRAPVKSYSDDNSIEQGDSQNEAAVKVTAVEEATAVATPSPSDPTRTSQPERPPRHVPPQVARLSIAPQIRDRERYDVLGEHGRGGLGRVSRVHDRELGRDIAIKELISRGHLSEVRFLREALITARLEHPGIVPVYEAGRWADGTPFYAMKLVAGRPLRDLLAEQKSVDERIGLLHHVIAVADAIAYAHGRSIIHRDLKPANVIVGDFGETVVIDWGLAKDLTATEESTVASSPFRTSVDDGLTSAGSVLGTPAYMPPEQARGEPVDQRADVFAIGAMLWELCTLQKLPPNYSGQRRRILRRAGIDADLITIIDKAVAPDPARRYPNAGALAADLKAFKVGARIAARRYSLLGLLTHWTRRHRALAISATVLLATAGAAAVLYVRNISSERSRADSALSRSEASKNSLTLEHAALLLRSDPTAALHAVKDYRGPDVTRAKMIAAEARGRGVAHVIPNVHTDTVYLLAGLADGSILSVGEDRKVALTRGDLTKVLASDLATIMVVAYSTDRQLLAYSTAQVGAKLLNVKTGVSIALSATVPTAFSFSPDSSQLAILDKNSDLALWELLPSPKLLWKERFSRAGTIVMTDRDRVLFPTPAGFTLVSLQGVVKEMLAVVPGPFDASSDRFIMGDDSGNVMLYVLPGFKSIGTVRACRERVRDVQIIPQKKIAAFVCNEGAAGVVAYSPDVVLRRRFVTQGAALRISHSESGNILMFLSDSTTIYVYDVEGQLVYHYEGQEQRPSCVFGPATGYPKILSGDVNGTIRVWDPPTSIPRVALHLDTGISQFVFSRDGTKLAAGAVNGALTSVELNTFESETKRVHTAFIQGMRVGSDDLLVTSGLDDLAIVWNFADLSTVRVFDGHQSRVQDLELEHGRALSVGDDGRLFRWSLRGTDAEVLFATQRPLVMLETIDGDGGTVVVDAEGAVWHVLRGTSRLLKDPGELVIVLRVSRDNRMLLVGTDQGRVIIFDTGTWQILRELQVDGPVRQASFSGDSSHFVVLSEHHKVQLVALDVSAIEPWREIAVDARDAAFSPDATLLAIVCSNGGIWFYSLLQNNWLYMQDHHARAAIGKFSPDGRYFGSSDRAGDIVIRDVKMTLSNDALLSSQSHD